MILSAISASAGPYAHCCAKCLHLQVFILDSLAGYNARDAKDAESIVERVAPRLQHANCAVVLSAVKASMTLPCQALKNNSALY